jgi:hypothetical protein
LKHLLEILDLSIFCLNSEYLALVVSFPYFSTPAIFLSLLDSCSYFLLTHGKQLIALVNILLVLGSTDIRIGHVDLVLGNGSIAFGELDLAFSKFGL